METTVFDPKKFTYNTKDPEMLKMIEASLQLEATPIAKRVEGLDEAGKSKFQARL